MSQIETERLTLRPIVESDAVDIFEYCRNPNVGAAAGWKPHENLEETLQIMKQLFIGQEHIFGMILKCNQKLIGTIGFLPDPHRENPHALMLGYAMSEQYWGKGLMTEAAQAIINYSFNHVQQLDLITCTCYPDNHCSFRVIEKCGFVHDGRLRQCEVRYDGAVKDMECFSLTKEEWNQAK